MLSTTQRLKLEILARGISVTPAARDSLTASGSRPLSIPEYATTGGITLVMPGDIYVNAPVGEWFCDDPAATLDVCDTHFVLRGGDRPVPVTPLALPHYLNGLPPDGVMTHADRVRLSPIDGCACACQFCDSHLAGYGLRDVSALMRGLRDAVSDPELPAKHALVSGGSPRRGDESRLDAITRSVLSESTIPVDVMLMPRESTDIIDNLVDWGVAGLSINLEVFSEERARELTPQKGLFGRDGYARTWTRAVELLGLGRVRSLLLLGLEDPEETLRGVDFIASCGVDPVLSPFRPAPNTPLAGLRPPSADLMEDVYSEAVSIAAGHGVALGPRCIPCQHNTITFPLDPAVYYYS